jgi:hypothetical protein
MHVKLESAAPEVLNCSTYQEPYYSGFIIPLYKGEQNRIVHDRDEERFMNAFSLPPPPAFLTFASKLSAF